MEKEKQNNEYDLSNYGFTIVPNYFFRKLIKVMGRNSGMVYLTLLSYCHKKNYIAWPSLNTMSKDMGIAKSTIIRNLNILSKLNFVKNITKDKSDKNYYKNNVYQVTPPEKIFLSLFSEDKNNSLNGSKMKPSGLQNATSSGSKMKPLIVAKRYPNNNNINNTNITTTNRKKDAVVVNFKKLKEKGEEKMLAIKEQLRDLDFEGRFIEQLLKDYPPRKIEEKLDLLMERRNIQNPAGWLSAALKNDYHDPEQERYDEEPVEQAPRLSRIDSRFRGNDIKGSGNDMGGNGNDKWVSREKALEAIKLIQNNLSACTSPLPSEGEGYGEGDLWKKGTGTVL